MAGAQLSSKLTLDASQHNNSLRDAAKELSKYRRDVDATDKQLKAFKQQSNAAATSITNFGSQLKSGNITGAFGSFTGLLNGASLKMGALGLAIGATTTALKVSKDAFFESEANYDEWQRVVQSSESVYNGFLNSINNGDISGFLSNIDQIVSAAREAYDALDTLGTMRTIQAPKISGQEAENQRMLMMLRTGRYIAPVDGRAPSPGLKDGQKLTNEQLKILEKQYRGGTNKIVGYTRNEVGQTNKAIRAYYNKLAKENGMSETEFIEGTRNWDEFSKRMEGYQNYLKWEAEAQKRFAQQGGRGHTNFDSSNPYYEFKKWGNFRVDKTGDNSLNDLGNLIKARDQQTQQLYSTVGQGYRAINKVEKQISGGGRGGSGGGRGGSGGRSNEPVYAQGSIGWYDEQISKIQKDMKFMSDPKEIENAQKQLEELKAIKDVLMHPTHGRVFGDDANSIALLAAARTPVSPVSNNIETQLHSKIQTSGNENARFDFVNPLEELYNNKRNIFEDVVSQWNMGLIGKEKAQELLESINETLEAAGLRPIEIPVEIQDDGGMSKLANDISEYSDAISMIGQGFEIPELDIAGVIGQSIANIMLGYTKATAEAGGTLGPWGWAAFSLYGLAQVAAMVSQVRSLSGYAEGGIIQGNRTLGDYNLARVNSGEMILNGRQQSNLFNLIDSGRMVNSNMGGQVTFYVHGKDLKGVLSNYDNKMDKVK